MYIHTKRNGTPWRDVQGDIRGAEDGMEVGGLEDAGQGWLRPPEPVSLWGVGGGLLSTDYR